MSQHSLARSALALLLFPLLLVAGALSAERATAAETTPLSGAAAYGDWRVDRPGIVRLIRPGDMPAPYASRSASNGPQGASLPRDPTLHVPPGFIVTLWADRLRAPRELKVAPNGDVFAAETAEGDIRVLRPDAATGKAGRSAIFASDLDGPFGMAFYPPGDDPHWLYVATSAAVWRYPYHAGDLTAAAKPERVIALAISDGGHSTRDLAFSPDGARLFVSVGSQSNDAEDLPKAGAAEIAKLPLGAAWGDEAGRAAVWGFDPDGSNGRIVSTGLRNCVGLAIAPGTGDLFCATNERDGLGDDLPPDYVTRVPPGTFFGWPWFYIGDHEDPRHTGERAGLGASVTVPDTLIQAHSAPLTLTFYAPAAGAAAAFPDRFRGQAFVALHGSWNRAKRTGYKVIRVISENGRPTGAYEDFLTGFVYPDGRVWGRPVGVAVMGDGALLVGEDENGTLWRISPSKAP